MKKFLSLALALVMTMSLVTISASASFTDDSEIAYAEAVDVMYALEIIGGYSDGSFDPDATLTRGAAAKIICNLMLGPTVASALGTNTAPFSDVAVDHTFAGYIAYCANEGIINGYTDGTFRPSGTITGYAFMKMLLGALGYDSSVEGYTDTNWAVNVSADAKLADLDDGNEDYDGSKALTREEACLYALNTLQADCVEYDNQSNITIGDIVISNSSTAKETGYTFMETYFSKLSAVESTDNFGRPITEWSYKSDDIGSYVDDSDLVASYTGKVTEATLYSLIGNDDDDTVAYWVDGVVDDYGTAEYMDYTKNSSSNIGSTGNSTLTEVYEVVDDNGDSHFTVVSINTYVVQAAADYSSSSEYLKIEKLDVTISGVSSYIYNDDVDVEDFEEEDYILVTIADGEIQSADLAEVIVGEVTSYTTSTSVYIDGTKYSYNVTIDNTDGNDNGKAVEYYVGQDASLVLDQYGNVIYVDEAITTSDNYVFITEFAVEGSFGKTYYAAAYFADGTYAEIEIDDVDGYSVKDYDDEGDGELDANYNGSTTSYDTVAEPYNWFTYKENSDGSYDLYNESQGTSVTAQYIYSSKTDFARDSSKDGLGVKADSNTVFVIVDEDDDVYCYTGITNVADIDSTAADMDIYYVDDTNSYADYVFIDATGSDTNIDDSEASSTDYVFILDGYDVSTSADDDIYYSYEAYVDGEIIDVDFEDALTESSLDSSLFEDGVGYVYNNIKTSGDYVSSATEVSTDGDADKVVASDYYISYSGNNLLLGTSDTSYESYILEDTDIVMAIYDEYDEDYDLVTPSSAKNIITELDGADTVSGRFTFVFSDDVGSTDEVVALFIFVTEYDDSTYTGSGSGSSSSDTYSVSLANNGGALELTVDNDDDATDSATTYDYEVYVQALTDSTAYAGNTGSGTLSSGTDTATVVGTTNSAYKYYVVVTLSTDEVLTTSTVFGG